MTVPARLSALRADLAVITLAASAGVVDALSFLGLGHVFTANMTGNILLLGVALGFGRPAGIVHAATAFAAFTAGALLAHGLLVYGLLTGHPSRAWPPPVARFNPRRLLVVVLVLEAAFTGAWAALDGSPDDAGQTGLIALLAVAMGIQSIAVAGSDLPGISTTYVTGMLARLLGEIVDPARRSTWTPRRASALVALTGGAALGTVCFRAAPAWTPAPALALLALAVAAGRIGPAAPTAN